MVRTKGPHDLLIVLDATASMGEFVLALNKSLPEIINLSALTGCFERIGVVTYRDYCGGDLTEWSGWCSPSGAVSGPEIVGQEKVLEMARRILPDCGGDWPEATKTGLALAYEKMREDATTIMLLYTDAPPHFAATGGKNYNKEKTALSKKGSYGGYGSRFVDWVSAAKSLKDGPKKAVVFSVVSHTSVSSFSPYLYLSTATKGIHFTIDTVTSAIISQLTLGILLTWMGAGKAVENDDTRIGVLRSYRAQTDIDQGNNETDSITDRYFSMGTTGTSFTGTVENTEMRSVNLKEMPEVLKARGPSVKNFAKRYVEDEEYKKLAVDQLRRIIDSNVSAVSVNPIFGTLWRTVCNDRNNEARDGLITAFGFQVDRIADAAEKARMKAWLEESYNYKAEIQAAIGDVPVEERFPVVYLDPTADFKVKAGQYGEEDADNRPLNEFTRGELLEIGRSCDYRILRRLGKVLTRLSYVEKPEDLPAHIKAADAGDVPQIPMALADPKHKSKFWKILLHAVLPGTMVTARPAAVLAALALRMGIVPLRDVADQELLSFRDNWNTIAIPETWNVGCLGLLLDADSDFEKRVSQGITKRQTPESSILKTADRKLFKTLVDYKMLEANMKTTLQAKIGWSPEKTKVALGPVVVCRECKFPRSVTIMSNDGICGMCVVMRECRCAACTRTEDREERLKKNVSVDHTEQSMGYWVECNRAKCRAQYVVYNPDALNVRPKCFYCRHSDGKGAMGPAPVVECSKCLNRVIWPEKYRPQNLDLAAFECSACATDVVTIITQDITAEALTKENGSDWVLKNGDGAIAAAFNGRSLFYTASHCDLANLSEKVEILPADEKSTLTIAGKLVRNLPEVRGSLQRWVVSRRTEAGVCSLCFSSVRKADLRRACGRTGCHQLICNGCTKDWYGLNASGRIINVAALSCAFCRRHPAPKTVAPFGLASLGNLRKAVEEAGSWVYAWCNKCGFAKQYVERACAAGAPPELAGWNCDSCEAMDSAKGIKTKSCPGCTATTQKVSGCDHITCPCGVHWCYACGEDVGERHIYSHMSREHGGLYTEVEDEAEDGWVHNEELDHDEWD
ncbi:hypothetical protein G7Z17_g9224 [Cylindrodendrum hubeiense]|uniref:RING-type domain-containing protein n=1 Tax=Cylindrodendrum hubeiense TaxID=595255 RepID=A0A9P5H758_9HYPO|nr:hypothetical protein G7Z17_g9224 [Cylindrodendrum hubeiense]